MDVGMMMILQTPRSIPAKPEVPAPTQERVAERRRQPEEVGKRLDEPFLHVEGGMFRYSGTS